MSCMTDFERQWHLKLQSLIGGLYDCTFDSKMTDYVTEQTKHMQGVLVDYIVHRKPIAQSIKFEDYPIVDYTGKPDPQLFCTTYHRCRRQYSQVGQVYTAHCKHSHPDLCRNFLDILEGLEFEKDHSVKYITVQFNLGHPLQLSVVNNFVKFPVPIYLAYLNYTFVCLKLYNDQDEEVSFGSLNTFLIGGFLPGYNFRRMPPCVIPFTLDGKQCKCGYGNEMMGWWPVEDDTTTKC